MSGSSFTVAWLGGDPAAAAFLPRLHHDAGARRQAAVEAARRRTDPRVLERLVVRTPAQARGRDALAAGSACCVITGQQAGLFGGPLFTLLKAASAVVDARALEAETGIPCVPLFWLQNEDHDLAEIASCAVLGPDGSVRRVAIEVDPGDLRSVGARRLGPSVGQALDALEELLGPLSERGPVMALLRRAYRPDSSPDAAFRELIEDWLGPWGLLVVDPRAPGLEVAAAPLHDRAFARREALAEALLARSAALRAAGFEPQVHVRPGSPLGFFHPEGLDGPRHRLDPAPGGFALVGTTAVVPTERAAQGPFSTSALLRPLLQDAWLPTAMTVLGPGELAYFAQLGPLYDDFGLRMPLAVPRARLRVIDEAADRLLRQLGLEPDQLARGREALLLQLAPGRPAEGGPTPEELVASLVEPLDDVFAGFAPQAAALDPGLAQAAEKTRANLRELVERLGDRYRRALVRGDQVSAGRLDRLLARLQPAGEPQERVLCWPWFGARFGPTRFVERVLGAIPPFDGRLMELRP